MNERSIDLSTLRPKPGAHRKRKRVGRGPGSGHGKTAGRGHKGSGARAGERVSPGFEGGQMPLARRLPKRGFRPPSRRQFQVVSLGDLARFPPGSVVDPERLRQERLVRRRGPIKLLSDGELPHALTVRVHAASVKAREKVQAAGGTVEVVAE